jgi:serine/threonine-protein kinase
VAVLGALAVAGMLGYVALRPGAAGTAAVQPAVQPATVVPVAVDSSRAVTAMAKVRINTEPDGAGVKEDGVELCSSTPCDILYKGADADPSREHKLTLVRQGYRPETRSVKVTDSALTVKLAKAEGSRIVPQVTARPEAAAVPTGYRTDVPY